ncbi:MULTISPECIES: DEAD/DEAH box helicase [unclassified Pantoea]|uniref:DEAD/DEAH box helicase n=1 Tax=unclassified Pantoea TaxID=2630326 RepID=UPI0024775CCC|nr:MULTISPECIES: DEAD/DEAH box helicase [unclassified Pantoea]GME29373.1 DEAD/DEAH box helicase [Pantoea sp. QMID3]GME29554.1 DEAD/DEAH box helicase [Pantoea sp. QMID1]GME49027.1 DEAD/DEAH box helicase [Pantoea sp. QMID4]GME50016.1 DEAD/DEAH box helicase [Pantoea sp. QMID2]
MKGLPKWLVNNSGFLAEFEQLSKKSVKDQFPVIVPCSEGVNGNINISYLLTCGSILSHSDDDICQDAALRIAQYCLQNDVSDQRKDCAALILDALSNNATLQLALNKGLLRSDFEKRLPLAGQLESTKRRIEHTIEVGADKYIRANKFQAEFWDAVTDNEWVSVSAPTSVGKSYILESWVEEYIEKNRFCTVVYIVPTRALITEVYNSLINRLDPNRNGAINIQTLPLKSSFKKDSVNLFVFTQERLNIFNNSLSDEFKIDLLVIDEAHKIGDSHRGVFLQYVLEMSCSRNQSIKVVFASPFTSNPEILLIDAPYGRKKDIVKSSYVTVNQNLIWIEQGPGSAKDWSMYLFIRGQKHHIGDFHLDNKPSPDSKRLPFIALALGGHTSGNVVYVNGAADAEKTAKQIADGIVSSEISKEVEDLIELSKKVIHERYALNVTLTKGVAFHYGNMPLIIKSEIERLFSLGMLKYLVCTSTLVEGVNMACKNIFIRGPKKGSGKPMKDDDFWNLAGRAGRWGKEFQGNVICIDTNLDKLWNGTPPINKKNIKITRATDSLKAEVDNIVDYIDSPHHYGMTKRNPQLQSLLSYLCISSYLHEGLENNPYIEKYNLDNVEYLNEKISEVLDGLDFPLSIVSRNPGISPILMQSLWEKFHSYDNDSMHKLLLADPASKDALSSYVSAFTRISLTMSLELGHNSKGAFVVALLVLNWMRGYPLARLISERIGYLRKSKKEYKEPTIIRNVMEDVEKIARYHAPRLLTCYNDLLKSFYINSNRADLVEKIDDIGVYLELGVSMKTQISLIGLGFSRTSAVMISEYISSDSLDEIECASWIENNKNILDDLPELVKFEIFSVINGLVL